MLRSQSINAKDITVDMVESFQITENYQQSYPCSHHCQIVLKDGRRISRGLYGPEIYLLIQAIAKEKITFKRDPSCLDWKPQDIDSFKEEYEYHDWEAFNDLEKPPLPEEILSRVFKNNLQ